MKKRVKKKYNTVDKTKIGLVFASLIIFFLVYIGFTGFLNKVLTSNLSNQIDNNLKGSLNSASLNAESTEVDKCSELSNEIKNNINILKSQGKNIVLREGDPVYSENNKNYIVLPWNGGIILTVSITNISYGYWNDKVRLTDISDSSNIYDSTITSEGIGAITVGGRVFQLRYFANDYSTDNWNITLNWDPLEQIDTFNNCPISSCIDSDNGQNFDIKGTVSILNTSILDSETVNYTDYCSDSPTHNTLREYYCENGNLKNIDYHCPTGKMCSDASCVNCVESWSCGTYSNCTDSKKTRECFDYNQCGTISQKPATEINCNSNTECSEDWTCSPWGSCNVGVQSRSCGDLKNCGTTLNRPTTSQSCSLGACTEDWSCNAWSECSNNKKTRICTDKNNCNTIVNRPLLSIVCGEIETPDNKNPIIPAPLSPTTLTKFYIAGREVHFDKNPEGKYIIVYDGGEIITNMNLINSTPDLFVKTSAGWEKKINILPEKNDTSNKKIISEKIEIIENNGEAVYLIKSAKKGRLFFIFPISANIEENINIESGKIVESKKPWWGFLAGI